MSLTSFHVLIVGGGLGGLCLAQGLRKAGISVALYERDASPVFRHQGYRLHIDGRGASGLETCLPPHLFELFMATTSQPGRQVTVLTKRLKMQKVFGGVAPTNSSTPAPLSTAVDRLTLRDILLAEMEDIVHFKKEFSHYEQLADGSVLVFFADGTEAHGDLLVAADGVNSRVRQQFLPAATVVDTNQRCIYGKTYITETTQTLIHDVFRQGFTMVIGFPYSMALGMVEFLHPPVEAAAQIAPSVQLHPSSSYLMWSFNAAQSQFMASNQELSQMTGPQLQQLVLSKMKSWHPDLHALVAAGDPEEIFPITIRVSTPCEPWESTSITLLGDAIHAMSPAGGSGANMALQDAHLLCRAVISVASGEKPLRQALHDYEARMLKDGFEAVRFSSRGGILNKSPRKSLLHTWLRLVRR